MMFSSDIYDGLDTRFQPEGVDFLASRRRAWLCDDMRLGKAVQCIRAADGNIEPRMLILCKAIARVGWMRKLKSWGVFPRSIAVIDSKKARWKDAEAVILNYDLAYHFCEEIGKQRFGVGIVDEAQALANIEARRTRAIYDGKIGVLRHCDALWLTTGSPMKNHPGELWTHLVSFFRKAMIRAGLPVEYQEFINRYCVVRETPYGQKIEGGQNLGELRSFLLDGRMLRRIATDDLLSPLTIEHIPLPGEVDASDLAGYDIGEDLMLFEQRLRDLQVSDEEVDARVDMLLNRATADTSRFRRLSGLAKVNPIAALVKSDFEEGMKKVIIFTWHQQVTDAYAQQLAQYGVVIMDGRRTMNQKQKAMDAFNRSANFRVALAQLETAGTSVELEADEAIVAESSWVPTDNAQAIARMRLITKRRPVRARFPSLAGTIDEALTAALMRKTKVEMALFNPEPR